MTPLPSILVADYLDHTARLWAKELGRAGYVVHCCRPVDVRPWLLHAYRPDVLIVAVSRVRGAFAYQDLEGRCVPVIVVSAHPSDRGRAAEYGCTAILTRPTALSSLLDAVGAVVPTRAADWATPAAISSCSRSPSDWLRKRSRELCDQTLDLRHRAADLSETSRKLQRQRVTSFGRK